jgi:hypothetical protein
VDALLVLLDILPLHIGEEQAVQCPGILPISLMGLVQLAESPQAVAFLSRDSAQALDSQRTLLNALLGSYPVPLRKIFYLSQENSLNIIKKRNKFERSRWR